MYQDTRDKSEYKGKWYAKAVPSGLVTTDELAERVQRNCSVKRSDVLAVLAELSEVMTDELLAGNRVRINGIGTFKVGFSSKPADTLEKWSVSSNISSAHINFQPEVSTTISNGKRTRSAKALSGIEFKELRQYNTPSEGA